MASMSLDDGPFVSKERFELILKYLYGDNRPHITVPGYPNINDHKGHILKALGAASYFQQSNFVETIE